jgi:hypothetical protein
MRAALGNCTGYTEGMRVAFIALLVLAFARDAGAEQHRQNEMAPVQPPPSDGRQIALPKFESGASLSIADEPPPKAHGDDGLDEETRVQKRLELLRGEWTEKQHAVAKDALTRQIGEGLANAFTVKPETARRASPNGIVAAFEQWQRDLPKFNDRNGGYIPPGVLAIAGQDWTDGTINTLMPRRPRLQAAACFGGCGIGSHEMTRLSARIALDHDRAGAPVGWAMQKSSGDPDFDGEAMAAAQLAFACLKESGHHVLFCRPLAAEKNERVPKRSEWVLHGIVYRWTHAERAADAQFRPSGRFIDAGPFAGHYLDTKVELVQLQYWP